MDNNPPCTPAYEAMRDAFLQSLDLIGTTLCYNGLERPCIASSIDKSARMERTGYKVTANPTVEMLREHYEELSLPNAAELTIDGALFVFDGIDNADRDPVDPCVTLKLKHRTRSNVRSGPANTFRG